jgi:hypothetical protein
LEKGKNKMVGEQYTLTLRHEIVTTDGDRYEFEPPLHTVYTMFDATDRGGMIYMVNNMFGQLYRAFIERLDCEKESR